MPPGTSTPVTSSKRNTLLNLKSPPSKSARHGQASELTNRNSKKDEALSPRPRFCRIIGVRNRGVNQPPLYLSVAAKGTERLFIFLAGETSSEEIHPAGFADRGLQSTTAGTMLAPSDRPNFVEWIL
jgi:hypothetical protein